MSYASQENSKNLIIEQHLYEYKKAPLESFTFLQISLELISVHHWIVELGNVIKVKPGVTRGPLCLAFKFITDSLVSKRVFKHHVGILGKGMTRTIRLPLFARSLIRL